MWSDGMIFKNLLILYLIAVFLMVIVPLGGFSTTLNNTTMIGFRLDYLLHALIFLPLTVLWHLGFPHHPLWLILAGSFLVAAGMEGLQYLLPYRAYNVNDMLGNWAGALLGGILVWLLGSFYKKSEKNLI